MTLPSVQGLSGYNPTTIRVFSISVFYGRREIEKERQKERGTQRYRKTERDRETHRQRINCSLVVICMLSNSMLRARTASGFVPAWV